MTTALGPLLRHKGMTQQQLADALGVSKGFVSEIVSGKKNPSVPMLRRIADILDAQTDDILTDALPLTPPGMGESDVAAFVMPPDHDTTRLTTLIGLLAPGANHVMAFRAVRAFPAFSILPNDVLLIGSPPQTQDGDLVVATLSDGKPHSAVTVLRQRMGERLVPPLHSRIDGEESMSTGVLGTVIATIRSPALA